jgi:acetyl-CoA C-acetyltransferase
LGEVAIVEAMRRAAIDPKEVSEIIMGQILTAGEGQNPARQAAVAAGIPFEATAYGVNQLCGSGLRTVALGYQAIRNGDSEIVVAGGQESMSQAPHCMHLRNGVKMGDAQMIDTMIKDGLWDAFQRLSHGQHAPKTSRSSGRSPASSRTSSPPVASQGRGGAERRPLQGRDRAGQDRSRRGDTVVDTDEHRSTAPRFEVLAKLRRPSTRTVR